MGKCCERHIKDSRKLTMYLYFSHSPRGFHVSTSYEIIKVPGDGHCMIHAWKIALQNSREIRNKPFYTQLYNSIYDEFTKNINHYINFVLDTTDIAEEVHNYLLRRDYASDIGDLVLQALANVTKTSAMIYIEDELGKLVQSSYIEPINGQIEGSINLLKSGQHYDVIVFGITGEAT